MRPQIQYTRTADGISIAFWALGDGRPFVQMPYLPFSNIEEELQLPEFRNWDERVARKRMLIRFDCRGSGLSERDVGKVSLDSYLLDLKSVVDHLGLESFDLFGPGYGGMVAIAYAVRHPERVSHLMLWATYARASDLFQRKSEIQGLLGLMDTDWEMFTETLAHTLQGWSEGEPASRSAALLRDSVTRDGLRAAYSAVSEFDVTSLLSQVRSPTLVLHRRQCRFFDMDLTKSLVSEIPDARLVLLEGSAMAFYLQDSDAVLKAIDEFLGEGKETARAAKSSPAGNMAGRVISHYRIIDKLGEGGMGVVYKAEDTKLRRAVALKFLPPELTSDPELKERFVREAQAASALDHPNIGTTYEIDEAEGQTFIAMAHVDGESLEKKIKSGPLTLDEAVDISVRVAEGLQEAHENGIVHRDIKSSNIMLTRKGQPKIMDFGLAKLPGRSRLTKTATIMGTLDYMSPEQARGEPVDHRADIWSLGVVLYEMLTGRLPFAASNEAGMIHKIISEDPAEVETLKPEVPAGLSGVVSRMMAKNRGDRYPSAAEFLKAIRSFRTPEAEAHVPTRPRTSAESQEVYKRAEKRVKAKLRFYRFLALYLVVNLLLMIINIATRSGYPWFLWPLGGLGVPVFVYWLKVFVFSRESEIRERMIEKELNRETSRKS
ncbi:MAG: alpha/beta fold hydrolase [Candidatus Hydrogenedentota bacterium]|nr:MAG: alpha/beta fold hydrolase [Candidatus Hydrogenedentota bacterium]